VAWHNVTPPIVEQMRPTIAELSNSPIKAWQRTPQETGGTSIGIAHYQNDYASSSLTRSGVSDLTFSDYKPTDVKGPTADVVITYTPADYGAILSHINNFVSEFEKALSRAKSTHGRFGPLVDESQHMPTIDLSSSVNLSNSLKAIEAETDALNRKVSTFTSQQDRADRLKGDA
jgi:hypothetical protein